MPREIWDEEPGWTESWTSGSESDRGGVRTRASLLPVSWSSHQPWGATRPPVLLPGGRKEKPEAMQTELYCWEASPCVSTVGSYIVDFPQEGVGGSQGVFISSICFSPAFPTPAPGHVVAPWPRESLGMADHPGCVACGHCSHRSRAGRMGWLLSSGVGGPGLFWVWPEVTHALGNPSPNICIQGHSYYTDYI